jgi:predicted O-methyltransferase YrrM
MFADKMDIRLELAFCPTLVEMLESRVALGKSGKAFENANVSTINNLLTLRRLMLESRPARTLEIGLCFGGSALVFAASHRDLNRGALSQHIVIDPYQESLWDSAGLAALETAGLAGYLDFRPRSSATELPALLSGSDRIGLVYVDGSHLFEDVFVDAYYATRLLDRGGVIAFDDSSNPHVRKVLRFIRSNLSGALKELDLGAYRASGLAAVPYRVARLIGRTQMTAFCGVGEVEREWDASFRDF